MTVKMGKKNHHNMRQFKLGLKTVKEDTIKKPSQLMQWEKGRASQTERDRTPCNVSSAGSSVTVQKTAWGQVRCNMCHEEGHIAVNCPKSSYEKASGGTSNGYQGGWKGSNFKGGGKGKGKTNYVNELDEAQAYG